MTILDRPNARSLGDMDDFTLLKKKFKKNLNLCFSFLFYRRLPANEGII